MTRQEFLTEFEGAQKQITQENEQRMLDLLLDLTRLCMETGHHDWGLEVVDFCKPRLIRMMVEASGMQLQELNDFMLTHNEYSDWRYKMYWDFVLEETYDRFIPFMLYMERHRPFAKKFYEPRAFTKDGKTALYKVAKTFQTFADEKKKVLTISLPPRVGKSTIFMFYLAWNAIRRPNSHSAYGGYSGVLAKGFYKELTNLLTSDEYCCAEIYDRWNPGHVFVRDKSAEDFTLNLDSPDRFSTLTCRGIDGSWTGIIDISKDGVLAVDDLIRDREHSMSPQRMENTWQEFLNKMVDRMNDGAQMVLIGTLWGVLDPIVRIQKMYEDDPNCMFLVIPALDDNDESNFDYFENGFSTQYYLDMRARLEDAEWQAKYQQRPYKREGLTFPAELLNYFDGIIADEDVRRVYGVIDVAVGGGDNVSFPICTELKNGRKPIVRWIYDKRGTDKTVPRVVDAIQSEVVTEVRIEQTGVGYLYSTLVRKELKARNISFCKVIPVDAPRRMTKEDKISGYSEYIKNNFEFLMPLKPQTVVPVENTPGITVYKRDEDYRRAMNDTCMFSAEGKNPTDDAPDSLAQLAIASESKAMAQIEVVHIDGGRPF